MPRGRRSCRDGALCLAITLLALPAGSTDAVTYGFLKEWARNDRELHICHMEWWSVSPIVNGWPFIRTGLASLQLLGSAKKDDAALRRFSELPRYLD